MKKYFSASALLVDKAIVQKNCLKMLNLASKMNITLRGQTKTHKTLGGALMQTGGTKRFKFKKMPQRRPLLIYFRLFNS